MNNTNEPGDTFVSPGEGEEYADEDVFVTAPVGEEDLLLAMSASEDLLPPPEEAFASTKAEAKKSERAFSDLSAIEHVRELWAAKGIHPSDPMYALMELLALWDSRQSASFLQLAALVEKSDIFHMSVLAEMQKLVERMEGSRADSEKMVVLTRANCDAMQALDKSTQGLLREMPELYGVTAQAVKVLGEMGRYQVILNMAIPVVCILIGMLAMFALMFFFGFPK